VRIFNAKIIDAHLEDSSGGGAGAESSTAWACLLPRAETLKFTCLIDTVTGSPTFTLKVLGSNADWNYQETTASTTTAPFSSATTVILVYSTSDPHYPPPRHLIVTATITGSGTKGHVKVWVCGRGPQLLEAMPPAGASFVAQYAAAKMIEDEDRLAGRKRALNQGASLFYPPELFLPSLKWDR
jgi:hypothetical protein